MRIAVYGGCFNPPHLGHLAAAKAAYQALKPDRFLILPDREPPHKASVPGEPKPEERLDLCRLAFKALSWAELSDLSFLRPAPTYMSDTLRILRERFSGDELILILGADMLLGIGSWHEAETVLDGLHLAVLDRDDIPRAELQKTASELMARFGTRVEFVPFAPVDLSSSRIREALQDRCGADMLSDEVYSAIIRNRWYGAKVSLSWLREQVYAMLKPSRIPHVAGCEKAAEKLAVRWGFDPEKAAEAGILHDMTKRWTAEVQLRYCRKNGIELDECELQSPQLLHARTGALEAKRLFGASDEICEAIRWHTTGKPEMGMLEKILYLADVTEENRNYPGVDELRALCFEDLDAAMALATRLCLKHVEEYGFLVHKDTIDAYEWYRRCTKKEEYSC